MSNRAKTKFEEFVSEPKAQSAFEQEALTIEATELISVLMEQTGVNRAELADRLGSSKAHISQVLSGVRNMTLHTLAEFLFALGHRAQIDAFPLEPRLSLQRSSYQIKGKPWSLLRKHNIQRKPEDDESEAARLEQSGEMVA